MSHYKAPDNSLHFLDDDNFVSLLPAGSIAITDEEAEALRPQPTAPTVQDQIVAIEAANPITHRNLRDLAMAVAALGELVTGQPAANLPMVQTIQSLEEQITALRAQL